MAELSISRAAFSGFSVAARRPWLIVVWAVMWFGSMLVAGIVMAVVMMATGLGAALSMGAGSPPDPAAMGQFIGVFIVTYLLFFLVMLFVQAVMTTAIYRSVLRPDPVGFAYIRIGADEFRQVGISLMIAILMICAYVAGLLVLGVLSLLLKGLGVFIGALLLIGLMTFVGIKLSLAGPQSLAEGKFNLFGSWRLTAGRFWATFASYLIPALIVVGLLIVIVIVLGMIFYASIGAAGLQNLSGLESNPAAAFTALGGMVIVFALVYLVVYPLFIAFLATVINAPPASVYSQVAEQGPEAVF